MPVNGLGERIRAGRLRRGFGLRELARKVDCSASMISQIENGMTNPSVSTLYAISAALEITTDSLIIGSSDAGAASFASREAHSIDGRFPARGALHQQHRAPTVLQPSQRRAINLERGVRWELLTPNPESHVEFMEVTYTPGGGSTVGEHAIRHNGREYSVILEGNLSVQVGFEQWILRPGESMAFDSTIPHRFWNDGDVPVRAIWFVIDRWFDSEPS